MACVANNCVVIGENAHAYADNCVVVGDHIEAHTTGQVACGEYLFDEPIPDKVREMICCYGPEVHWLLQVTCRQIQRHYEGDE